LTYLAACARRRHDNTRGKTATLNLNCGRL
jgi:hypothetical protein